RFPSMAVSAPAARAFTRSPDPRIPPSAMIGTPASAAASPQLRIAVSCGTPAPVTTRVVQVEPGPTPTFTPSTPQAMRSRVPSAVATLPAIRGTSGHRAQTASTVANARSEWPWAMSITRTSTSSFTRASARSRGHRRRDRTVELLFEQDVPRGDDAEQAAVAVDHQDAGGAVLFHERGGVPDRRLGADRVRRLDDHALGALDPPDLGDMIRD